MLPKIKKLAEIIREFEAKKRAVGHFNVSNSETLSGIFKAARRLGLPVIIGVSEGERDFLGIEETLALVSGLREKYGYPIYSNADHTYSFERVKEAVDAGFDAVIFDGAALSMEENIKITRECVRYAKSKNPDILVEGEVGFIGRSSVLLDEMPKEAASRAEDMADPEEVRRFVEETGVDLIAPAVGNIHGMLRHGKNPGLDMERIREIRKVSKVPLVLHGGSGLSDEDFKKAVEAGISVVHINTEIRVAFRDALRLSLQENPDEIAPYKIMKGAVLAVERKVAERMALFAGI